MCRHLLSFQWHAQVKDVKRTRPNSRPPQSRTFPEAEACLRNEVEVLSALQHANIVRLVGVVVVSESEPVITGLILPFYAEGCLHDYMKAR